MSIGTGAAWHLASIEVEDLSTRKVSTFHCDRWLSKSKGDKQIVRELTCADGRQTSGECSEQQTSNNQSVFYFMSVHIEVILDKNKKQKHIIIIYTNFPTGL